MHSFPRVSVFRRRYTTFALLVLLAFVFAAISRANPTGGSVTAGSAKFQSNGSALTITTGVRTIIDWQDFSIGSGELTKFIQPSASAVALNRVVSGNPSSLLGS